MTNKVRKEVKQEGALKRLEAQLASGVKTKKGTHDEKVPLTDKDIKRINKEIKKLEIKLGKTSKENG